MAIRDWLAAHIRDEANIAEAYLFGSVMRGAEAPNDVDVAIITLDQIGSPGWERVRSYRDVLVPTFARRFGLPLSIIIASPNEWPKLSLGVVQERELLYRKSSHQRSELVASGNLK